jgi:Zn-dependent protease
MSGIPIGHLFGIHLRLHWSWFIIAMLIASSFAVGSLPIWHPAWTSATNWLVGATAAIALFASILLHELAHSVMANRLGTTVDHITFFLFGGVSNLHHEPESPRNEFLITAVGPLTSLAIGVVTLGTAMGFAGDFTPTLADQPPANTVLLWIGEINLALAIFNLLPGFPLDGGRLLRAAVWHRSGDLQHATAVAARGGRGVAWGLVLIGVAMLVGIDVPWFGSGIGGIWLIGIGYFLMIMNIRSQEAQVLESRLSTAPVRSIMRAPRSVEVDTPIDRFVDRVLHGGEHAYAVRSNGAIAGVVCAHDVARCARSSWNSAPVASIMTPAPRMATVGPDEPLTAALDTLQQRQVNELLVMDQETLVGVLEMRDLTTWLQLSNIEAPEPS